MQRRLALITLVVREYDEAIRFYVDKLGFTLLEDTSLGGGKRWVRVGLPGSSTELLLARATTPDQTSRIGNQTGGRVFLFLHTDDFDAYFDRLQQERVEIVRPPSIEAYGKVAVFRDLYGNLWDLIEPKAEKGI